MGLEMKELKAQPPANGKGKQPAGDAAPSAGRGRNVVLIPRPEGKGKKGGGGLWHS
jgi:hypothetical protein